MSDEQYTRAQVMGLILALRFVRFGVGLTLLAFTLAYVSGFGEESRRPLTIAYLLGLYVFLIGNVLCILRFRAHQQRLLLVLPVLYGAFGQGFQASSWGLTLWVVLLLGWIQAFVSEAEKAPTLGQVAALRFGQMCLASFPVLLLLPGGAVQLLSVVAAFVFALSLIWAWTRWLVALRDLEARFDEQKDQDNED